MDKISPPTDSDDHALDRAAKIMNGRQLLAEALGVSVAAIGNWKTRGVPVDKCVAIWRLTGGVITRQELRPDDWQDYWPELVQAQPAIILDVIQNDGAHYQGPDRRRQQLPVVIGEQLDLVDRRLAEGI